MVNEVWKSIVIEKNEVLYDYTESYEISNYGRVRSLDRIDTSGHRRKGKILKLAKDKYGYFQVGLSKDGKVTSFLVHRLVATMFIDNPNELPQVNHKDEDKTNNHIENLEWCTQEYNHNYGTRNERAGESNKGKTHTEETKRKIGDKSRERVGEKHWNYGKTTSEETKQKISKANKGKLCGEKNHNYGKDFKGENNPMYGKHHTEESKRRNSESHKGKYVGENNPRATKVLCVETGQIFNTIKQAQEWLGKCGIGQCCSGKNKTCGGYTWKYVEVER